MHNFIKHRLRRRYDEHYHPRHRFGSLHLVLDIVFALIIGSLAVYNGYLYFWAPPLYALPMNLSVSLTPNPPLTAGATSIHIHYAYHGSTPATDAGIQVKIPSTYEITKAVPSDGFDGKSVRWSVGELTPNTSGDLTLEGTYWGTTGHPDEVVAQAEGTLSNKDGSAEQDYAQAKTIVEAHEAAIETQLDIPSTIVLDQPTAISVTVTNHNDTPMNGLQLIPTTPSTWKTTNAEPSMDHGAWVISSLAPQASRKFLLEGVYARVPDSPSFFFRLERTVGTGSQEISVARADTTILDPSIELTAHVDEPDQSANPGDPVKATITYRNRGEFPLENVVVTAEPSGEYVDTSTIDATGGTTTNGKAQWDSDHVSTLSQLVTDQGGEFHLSFRLKKNISLIDRSPLEDFLLTITPRATFHLPILPNQTVQWTGITSEQKMNSSLGLLAQTRYWTPEGEQLGRGPLPPRVGSRTTYWVTVNISNTIHDLYQTKITIPLTDAVKWTGRSSVSTGSPLEYDKTTKSLIWDIGRLDNFLGTHAPEVSASIELAVTPRPEDRATTLTLVKAASAVGIDAITKTPLTATSADATTDLSSDQRGGGKGEVQ